MRRSASTVLLLFAVAGAATGFYIAHDNERRPVLKSAESARPEWRMISNSVNATGTVRLRVGSEVRVGSQLSGIVKKLHVTVGSRVHAGEVIAEIDDAPIQARLAQAEAQAQLDRTSMERVQMNYRLAQKLGSQRLIPAQQEEDLRLAFAEAQAKYEKSLRDRDLVKVDLGYIAIRAPISGTVASVSTQEGETVAASFTAPTFVTIIGDDALQLVAMVDETDIANIKPGNPVNFTVDSYTSKSFLGVVESIAPKATIISGVVNYEVTVEIRKDSKLLKPDMTANVSIETAKHQALVLPAAAVQRDGEQSFVYLQGKDGLEHRPVVVGTRDGGMFEIKKGITRNEEVLLLPKSGPTSQNSRTSHERLP